MVLKLLEGLTVSVLLGVIYGVLERRFIIKSKFWEFSKRLFWNIYIYTYHVYMWLLFATICLGIYLEELLLGNLTVLFLAFGNFILTGLVEDITYFLCERELPKDGMTPLKLSWKGVVWWYPISLSMALLFYSFYLISSAPAH